MTTRKRILVIAAVPLAIAVALGVITMLPPSPGVTKANFDRIQEGTTEAEVEEIFGRQRKWTIRDTDCHCWVADDGSKAWIGFTDECVTFKQWIIPDETILETILDKLRRWLHLP